MGTGFESLADPDLAAKSEEELIARAAAARDDGDADRLREALGIIAGRRFAQLKARALLRVADEGDAEDIASQAIVDALRSATARGSSFRGSSPGELASWLHRILSRRIADHYRRRAPVPVSALQGHDEGSGSGDRVEPAVDDDPADRVAVRDCLDRALSELSEPHREVLELFLFGRLSAGEIVAAIAERHGPARGMTEDNVHKIVSRCRARLRELLDGEVE